MSQHKNMFRTMLREKVQWGLHYKQSDLRMYFHMWTGVQGLGTAETATFSVLDAL